LKFDIRGWKYNDDILSIYVFTSCNLRLDKAKLSLRLETIYVEEHIGPQDPVW
jgi:hypothetical protein